MPAGDAARTSARYSPPERRVRVRAPLRALRPKTLRTPPKTLPVARPRRGAGADARRPRRAGAGRRRRRRPGGVFAADAARRGGGSPTPPARYPTAASRGAAARRLGRERARASAHADARVPRDDRRLRDGRRRRVDSRSRARRSAATRVRGVFQKPSTKKKTEEEAAPLRFSSGWTLRLGDGEAGPRGRDAETQRRVAEAFAAAVAERAADVSPAAPTLRRRAALDSRLLPGGAALRRVAPRVAVRVAVEDDLDRLVASEAARRAGLVAAGDQHPRARRETDGVAIEIETNARDLSRPRRRASSGVVVGAFLDSPPGTARPARRSRRAVRGRTSTPPSGRFGGEAAAGGARGRRRRIRGVLAVLNVSDDVEYWDGLAIDLLSPAFAEPRTESRTKEIRTRRTRRTRRAPNSKHPEFGDNARRCLRAWRRSRSVAPSRAGSPRVARHGGDLFSDSKSAEDSNHLRVGPTRPVVWDEARPKAPRGRLGAALLAWATEALHHRREAAAGFVFVRRRRRVRRVEPSLGRFGRFEPEAASSRVRRGRARGLPRRSGSARVGPRDGRARGGVRRRAPRRVAPPRRGFRRRRRRRRRRRKEVPPSSRRRRRRSSPPSRVRAAGRARVPRGGGGAMGATSFRRNRRCSSDDDERARFRRRRRSFDSRGARAAAACPRPCTTRGRGASSGARSSPRGRRWRGGAWRKRRRRGFEDRATGPGAVPFPIRRRPSRSKSKSFPGRDSVAARHGARGVSRGRWGRGRGRDRDGARRRRAFARGLGRGGGDAVRDAVGAAAAFRPSPSTSPI